MGAKYPKVSAGRINLKVPDDLAERTRALAELIDCKNANFCERAIRAVVELCEDDSPRLVPLLCVMVDAARARSKVKPRLQTQVNYVDASEQEDHVHILNEHERAKTAPARATAPPSSLPPSPSGNIQGEKNPLPAQPHIYRKNQALDLIKSS